LEQIRQGQEQNRRMAEEIRELRRRITEKE
jgi:hypothetical protein